MVGFGGPWSVNPLKTTQVLTLPVALAHSPIGTNGERFRGTGRRLWNLAAQARLGVEGVEVWIECAGCLSKYLEIQ